MAQSNSLINETSPYLLQHAHNPVEWYPWNEESLAKAKAEDKPILLSIGYSSCHWCHVMEKECFERTEVAEVMNKYFINIKLDREERPDVDAIYMDAVQSMGLGGGWPLNVFLTSEQRPFYGGTYFPKDQWINVLQQVANVYNTRRQEIEQSADTVAEALGSSEVSRLNLLASSYQITPDKLKSGVENLVKNLDFKWGGQNKAPKFPMPSIWQHLLYFQVSSGDDKIKEVLKLTLDRMAAGGIYDHVGGGFARYSVDEKWHVPHFEKMLYDNAQLISLYADAAHYLNEPRYMEVVKETIEFLNREMKSEDGGYFSALDADSEGVEGKFYVWDKGELDQLLSEDEKWVIPFFKVTSTGNWEGANVLWHDVFQSKQQNWIPVRKKLLKERGKRIRPGLDDKVVCGWNGLLLTGLTKAYLVSLDSQFLQYAEELAEFIKKHLYNEKEGALYRTWKNHQAKTYAFLEDYAAVIQGMLHLYQAGFNEKWLDFAHHLMENVMESFYDQEEGFFHYASPDQSSLIVNRKELFDNVIPASNSLMAENLTIAGRLLEKETWLEIAKRMTGSISQYFDKDLAYLSQWAHSYLMHLAPSAEIAISGPDCLDLRLEFLQYKPFNLVYSGAKESSDLPLLKDRKPIDSRTTLYTCFHSYCKQPVFSVADAMTLVNNEFERKD